MGLFQETQVSYVVDVLIKDHVDGAFHFQYTELNLLFVIYKAETQPLLQKETTQGTKLKRDT